MSKLSFHGLKTQTKIIKIYPLAGLFDCPICKQKIGLKDEYLNWETCIVKHPECKFMGKILWKKRLEDFYKKWVDRLEDQPDNIEVCQKFLCKYEIPKQLLQPKNTIAT